jgi:hypothetical protein
MFVELIGVVGQKPPLIGNNGCSMSVKGWQAGALSRTTKGSALLGGRTP